MLLKVLQVVNQLFGSAFLCITVLFILKRRCVHVYKIDRVIDGVHRRTLAGFCFCSLGESLELWSKTPENE